MYRPGRGCIVEWLHCHSHCEHIIIVPTVGTVIMRSMQSMQYLVRPEMECVMKWDMCHQFIMKTVWYSTHLSLVWALNHTDHCTCIYCTHYAHLMKQLQWLWYGWLFTLFSLYQVTNAVCVNTKDVILLRNTHSSEDWHILRACSSYEESYDLRGVTKDVYIYLLKWQNKRMVHVLSIAAWT